MLIHRQRRRHTLIIQAKKWFGGQAAPGKMAEKESYLEDEVLVVRHSGEIPEVAYHGALYYLTEDSEGPALKLDDADLNLLRQQVVARYREIILRDLIPENRDKTLYRGLARCIVNWERCAKFCSRHNLAIEGLRIEVQNALRGFFRREMEDVRHGGRTSCINCSTTALEAFCSAIGIDSATLPDGWQGLCCLA